MVGTRVVDPPSHPVVACSVRNPGVSWLTNQQQSRRPLKGGLPPMGGGIQEDKDSWHAIVGWKDRWKRWRTQNDSEGDDRPRAAPVKNLVASDTASAGSNAFA